MATPGSPRLRPAAVPPPVLGVLRRLTEAGHRAWLVGGVVRDLLLDRTRHDPGEFDVASKATPAEVQALFRKVIPTGIDHGTVTVVEGGARVEVTTFRGEEAYVDGRRPSRVTFHDDLEADLARRDFTVNAMAWDPLSGELRDPHGGRADLARKLIRAVGDPRERFAEDGLRPLRGVRFVSQLGFRLAPSTRDAIPGALQVVALVSRERVAEELSRLLVGPHAAGGIAALSATGLLPVVLPRLAALPPARVRHALAVASEPFAPCPQAAVPEEDRERCRLLRMAALLHVLPPEEAMQAVVELRLPNRLATGVVALSGGSLRARREGAAGGNGGARGTRRWLVVGRARTGPALPRALEGRRPAPGGANGDAGRRGPEVRGQGGGRAPRRRAALGRRAGAGREGRHRAPPGNLGEGGRRGPAPPPRRGPGDRPPRTRRPAFPAGCAPGGRRVRRTWRATARVA